MAREPFQLVQRAGVAWLRSGEFARLPCLVHGFSTRFAQPPGGSDRERQQQVREFNLGLTEDARRRKVQANRRRFFEALADGFKAASLKQIHSATIYQVANAGARRSGRTFRVKGLEYVAAGSGQPGREDQAGSAIHDASAEPTPVTPIGEPLAAGDALVTAEPGILLTIRTADCLPVLLVDRRLRVMAAVHAGWRGTLAGVVEKTARELRRLYNSRPEDLVAALGPAIGPCCYEVGDEVVEAFRGRFSESDRFFHRPLASSQRHRSELRYALLFHTQAPPGHGRERARIHLDLAAAARAQLLAAGHRPAANAASGYCPACREDLFFSYRREGAQAGRMIAAIGLRR